MTSRATSPFTRDLDCEQVFQAGDHDPGQETVWELLQDQSKRRIVDRLKGTGCVITKAGVFPTTWKSTKAN